MKKLIFLLFLAVVFLPQCQSDCPEGSTSKKIINPNGDSELALLMRDMYDNNLAIKNRIKTGKGVGVVQDYSALHTADATQPEKVGTQEYKEFANAYLSSVNALQAAKITDAHKSFNGMVDNCMNCHQAICPGPMVKIKKLYLKG